MRKKINFRRNAFKFPKFLFYEILIIVFVRLFIVFAITIAG